MRHLGTVRLETPRLFLRPMDLDDCHAMFENWAGDPAVTRWLRWDAHRDWTVTAEILYLWQQQTGDPTFYNWGICRKTDGMLLGSISFTPPAEDGMWMPGYCLGRAFWGQGYATEALREVCRFWFEEVQGESLCACHAVENPASGRVLEKAGFRFLRTGVHHKFDGTPVNCRFYVLNKEDLTI